MAFVRKENVEGRSSCFFLIFWKLFEESLNHCM